ncbi:MAG TPA: S24 family peptidase [Gammaproteobacteria bacterium]
MSRLRDIRTDRGLSQEDVARALKCSPSSVSRYETEDSRLSLPLMQRLAEVLDCTVAEIAGERPVVARTPGEGPVMIPVYDVRVSAGSGSMIDAANVIDHQPFMPGWLRRFTTARPDQLAVVPVDGDSMFPTLSDGDQVLIDTTQVTPNRDGIYVVVYEGNALVKRVSVDPSRRRINLGSDNPQYRDYEVEDPSSLHVAGRVVWLGRRV